MLVEPLGFSIADRELKRAGPGLLGQGVPPPLSRPTRPTWRPSRTARRWLFSARAATSLYDARFEPGDHLVFGSEVTGLRRRCWRAGTGTAGHHSRCCEDRRSLNLSTSVGSRPTRPCDRSFHRSRQASAPGKLRGRVEGLDCGDACPLARRRSPVFRPQVPRHRAAHAFHREGVSPRLFLQRGEPRGDAAGLRVPEPGAGVAASRPAGGGGAGRALGAGWGGAAGRGFARGVGVGAGVVAEQQVLAQVRRLESLAERPRSSRGRWMRERFRPISGVGWCARAGGAVHGGAAARVYPL